jgi:hypothetical protein
MNTLKTVYEKLFKEETTNLASHEVHLAKSLKELEDIYKELQKSGEGVSNYTSMLKQVVTGFNNTGKAFNILSDRYKTESDATIKVVKDLGLEVPNSVLNQIKFIGQYRTKAKSMFDLANKIEAGLKNI